MLLKLVGSAAFSAVVEVDRSYRRQVGASIVVTQLHLPQCEPAFLPILNTSTDLILTALL